MPGHRRRLQRPLGRISANIPWDPDAWKLGGAPSGDKPPGYLGPPVPVGLPGGFAPYPSPSQPDGRQPGYLGPPLGQGGTRPPPYGGPPGPGYLGPPVPGYSEPEQVNPPWLGGPESGRPLASLIGYPSGGDRPPGYLGPPVPVGPSAGFAPSTWSSWSTVPQGGDKPLGYLGPPVPGGTRPGPGYLGPPIPGPKPGPKPWPEHALRAPPGPRPGYLGPPVPGEGEPRPQPPRPPPRKLDNYSGWSPGAGQGWLTPFGEDVPQLFQGLPGFIGGFSQGQQMKLFGQLANMGAFPQGTPTPPSSGTDLGTWAMDLVRSGRMRPEALFWLLGMMRGEHNPWPKPPEPWWPGRPPGPKPPPGSWPPRKFRPRDRLTSEPGGGGGTRPGPGYIGPPIPGGRPGPGYLGPPAPTQDFYLVKGSQG